MYLENGIFMHKKMYVLEVLNKFKIMGYKPVETHVELNVKLKKGEDEWHADGTMFRQMVGSLRYICHNRP